MAKDKDIQWAPPVEDGAPRGVTITWRNVRAFLAGVAAVALLTGSLLFSRQQAQGERHHNGDVACAAVHDAITQLVTGGRDPKSPDALRFLAQGDAIYKRCLAKVSG